jgi:hypothetical protein
MTEGEFLSRIPVEFRFESILTLNGELRPILAPRTVGRILPLLPIDSRLHLWTQQAYFVVGAKIGPEKAVTHCRRGDLAYWPQGDAICIFLKDMTPLSKVNPIGRVTTEFSDGIPEKLRAGTMVRCLKS